MSVQRPQAPSTGRIARLLGRFHVTGVFWFRLHRFGVGMMPRWTFGPIILLCTIFFFFALRRIRRAIASNLIAVLGPASWWETQRRLFRTMHSFAWCLTERYENLARERPFEVDVASGHEAYRQVGEGKEGAILLTGHLGNWEVGSALPSSRKGRDVHLVREEELDPRAQEFIGNLLREKMGPGYHTHFASDDPRLGLRLMQALREGAVVALQGDRPRAGGKTVIVRMFDRPLELPLGPAALARAAGAPMYGIFMLRTGRGTYSAHFADPIHVQRSARRDEDLREAMQQFATALEQVIRREPHQWFCFRELWEGSGDVGAERTGKDHRVADPNLG